MWYGKRFGFLDKGEDVEGTMKQLHAAMIYSTLVGIYAEWHPRIFGFMSRFEWSGAGARVFLMKFVQARIDARKKEQKGTGGGDVEKVGVEEGPEDFLDKMLKANKADPKKVTDYHIFMMGLSNIIAGSDTTAVSLSAILYNLVKYPDTMRKLREEVERCEAESRCGHPYVSFKQSQDMPYLQAVMKEALRIHSATGLPLWRVVPHGGAEISGRFFPEATVIGVNTWVAHFNEDVFGKDAKQFRPERWIEAEKEDGERLKEMEAYYMPFGLGSRTCLGKHISILEMSKLIPQLVRKFDFELEKADKEWETTNVWFVKPVDFTVKVKLRNSM